MPQKFLNHWGFLSDYNKDKPKLIKLLKMVYHVVDSIFPYRDPMKDEVTEIFTDILRQTDLFEGFLNSKPFFSPLLYDVAAEKMAQHTVDDNWDDII